MARPRCPCTLPWMPHVPTSTQDLVSAWGDVAEGNKPFSAGLKTPFCFALPAWSSRVTQQEKNLGSASGDSTGNKVLLAWCLDLGRGRNVAGGGSGPLLSSQGCSPRLSIRALVKVEKLVAKPIRLPPPRETGSISWDYMQHLKENIYRIYIHIPFTLFSGALPPSRSHFISPAPPPSRLPPPPRPATIPAFVRGTMFTLHRGWGDWK